MRPAPFERAGCPPLPGAADLVKRGLARLMLGLVLVLAARVAWSRTGSHLLATALALPGLSFMLHFGIFNLAAGVWRQAGVDVHALFRDPLRSRSLAEFWGRRWNLAFSEMTAIGTGVANSVTRSNPFRVSAPSRIVRIRWSTSASYTAIRRGVNAGATSRRRRVCSGGFRASRDRSSMSRGTGSSPLGSSPLTAN